MFKQNWCNMKMHFPTKHLEGFANSIFNQQSVKIINLDSKRGYVCLKFELPTTHFE